MSCPPARASLPNCSSNWKSVSASHREHLCWLTWRRATCCFSCNIGKAGQASADFLRCLGGYTVKNNEDREGVLQCRRKLAQACLMASAAIPIEEYSYAPGKRHCSALHWRNCLFI